MSKNQNYLLLSLHSNISELVVHEFITMMGLAWVLWSWSFDSTCKATKSNKSTDQASLCEFHALHCSSLLWLCSVVIVSPSCQSKLVAKTPFLAVAYYIPKYQTYIYISPYYSRHPK